MTSALIYYQRSIKACDTTSTRNFYATQRTLWTGIKSTILDMTYDKNYGPCVTSDSLAENVDLADLIMLNDDINTRSLVERK